MIKARLLATIASAVALGFMPDAGVAVPLAQSMQPTKTAARHMDMIEGVHRCNRICRRGPVEEWGGLVRWHLHVGPQCRVVRCRPE
jgi:hypothetical protein